jgi:hypothetical protein
VEARGKALMRAVAASGPLAPAAASLHRRVVRAGAVSRGQFRRRPSRRTGESRITMRRLAVAIVLVALEAAIGAQWLNQPTTGVPRLPDGKPNLKAPAPRTSDGKPDLSGLWTVDNPAAYVANIATDLARGDVQPWADTLYMRRLADLGKDDPGTIGCLPLGPRHITGGGTIRLAKIVQTPALMVVLYEDLAYRQIFLDGRDLPRDPNPSWMGYSVGHWEGEALVVDTVGFNDRTWLDFGGHPHTEALRMTERFQRADYGHMAVQVTIADPGAFAKPWSISTRMGLAADTELLEYVCAENERDRAHLVGRTEQERSVQVARSILERYVGVYEASRPNANFAVSLFTVTLEGDQLYVAFGGNGRIPLVPLSETTFSPRLLGSIEFVSDARGIVTHLIAHSTEEDTRAVRRP